MARLLTAGAETATEITDGIKPGWGVFELDTSIARSGRASWRLGSSTSYGVAAVNAPIAGTTTGYFRAYTRFQTLGMWWGGVSFALTTLGIGPRVTDVGELLIDWSTGTEEVAAVEAERWYCQELGIGLTAGRVTRLLYRLDGELLLDQAVDPLDPGGDVSFWLGNADGGHVAAINIDDIALNDATGERQNSWPGAGRVLWLPPSADVAVGSGWQKPGGATTGLGSALDALPPAGVADTTRSADAERQIRNAVSTATSDVDVETVSYGAAVKDDELRRVTPVDRFDRADGPAGANWSNSHFVISGGRAQLTVPWEDNTWLGGEYGPDMRVGVTVSGATESYSYMAVRLDVDTGYCYYLSWWHGWFALSKSADGIESEEFATWWPDSSIPAGGPYSVMLEAVGAEISVHVLRGGRPWERVIHVTDTSVTHGGTCDLVASATGLFYDDFVVETIPPRSPREGIVVAQALAATGSSNATDTAGALHAIARPSQPAGAFPAFDDGVAAAFPTGWRRIAGPVSYAPQVGLEDKPVVRIGKRTATTRVALVTQLGMTAEYGELSGGDVRWYDGAAWVLSPLHLHDGSGWTQASALEVL